jgi:SAM-dependent methyltransferase
MALHPVFFEIHSGLPREGPGSFASTQRAFRMLSLPEDPLILDVGCGPGRQTLDLAELGPGRILALDRHEPFLREVRRRAAASGRMDRIHPVLADMAEPPLRDRCLDAIWAEASIYIVGFQSGLELWKSFLKPGGCAAVSELSWLRTDPPDELRRFWRGSYPGMGTVAENAARIQAAGYELLGHFALPARDWWDDYYTPIEAKLAGLRVVHRNDPTALEVIADEETEMDLHRRYADFYGYVFYVMQVP